MAEENCVEGGGSTPTTPTNVEQTANNLDIDDFVNKYLKVKLNFLSGYRLFVPLLLQKGVMRRLTD